PRELEREVSFDRRVYFAGPAVVNIPTAIRKLALENVAHAALLQRVVHLSQPMHEENVIGAERAIDEQLAAPMAVRMLLSQQIFLRLRYRVGDLGVVVIVTRARFRRGAGQRDQVEGLRS